VRFIGKRRLKNSGRLLSVYLQSPLDRRDLDLPPVMIDPWLHLAVHSSSDNRKLPDVS
jgi:hypothetical protein